MAVKSEMWCRLSDLHGRRSESSLLIEKSLSASVPHGILDSRGILLSTADRLCTRPSRVVKWLEEGLSLKGLPHWPMLRRPCTELTASFFAQRQNAAAWVNFESSRYTLSAQAPQHRTYAFDEEWTLPIASGGAGKYEFRSVDESASTVSLDRAGVRFIDRDGLYARRLARFARIRSIMTPVGLVSGLYDSWCAADPVDDRIDVQAGRAPASMPLRVTPAVSATMMINWVAIDRQSNVDLFSIEIHPGSGEIVTVRRSHSSFELFLRIHGRYQEWLARLVDGADFNLEAPPPTLSEGLVRQVSRLLAHPTSVRFNLWTSLRVLLEYVRLGSLRQAGIACKVGAHKDARRHLANLERLLQIDLVDSSVNHPGRLNCSSPTPLAHDLCAWIRSHPSINLTPT